MPPSLCTHNAFESTPRLIPVDRRVYIPYKGLYVPYKVLYVPYKRMHIPYKVVYAFLNNRGTVNIQNKWKSAFQQ